MTLVIFPAIARVVSNKFVGEKGIRFAHGGKCATLMREEMLNIDYLSLFGGSGWGAAARYANTFHMICW